MGVKELSSKNQIWDGNMRAFIAIIVIFLFIVVVDIGWHTAGDQ